MSNSHIIQQYSLSYSHQNIIGKNNHKSKTLKSRFEQKKILFSHQRLNKYSGSLFLKISQQQEFNHFIKQIYVLKVHYPFKPIANNDLITPQWLYPFKISSSFAYFSTNDQLFGQALQAIPTYNFTQGILQIFIILTFNNLANRSQPISARLYGIDLGNIINRCFRGVTSSHYFCNHDNEQPSNHEQVSQQRQSTLMHGITENIYESELFKKIKTVAFIFKPENYAEVLLLYGNVRNSRQLLSKFDYFCQFYQKMAGKTLYGDIDFILRYIMCITNFQATEIGTHILGTLDEALKTYILPEKPKNKSSFSFQFFADHYVWKKIPSSKAFEVFQIGDYDLYDELKQQLQDDPANLQRQLNNNQE